MKSTNYYDAFIAVAGDCPAVEGEAPPQREKATVAAMQYEMLAGHPYEYTSDDVIFEVHARKNHIAPEDRDAEREAFFSIGRACLRSSPLVKRYGWGIHSDRSGRIAIYGVQSDEYQRLLQNQTLTQLKGMRSSRG